MAKTQGLLAYLAIANGQPVHRATLQDLLWSDRDQRHGRDSLKKALAELRLCLSSVEPNPLETSRGPVRLRPEAFDVDVFDRSDSTATGPPIYRPGFLDGLDIRDSEFNRWLGDVRSRLEETDATTPAAGGQSARATSEGEPEQRELLHPLFEVGVLPADVTPGDGLAENIANLLVNEVIALFDQSSVIRPYDFRTRLDCAPRAGNGPDVLLRMQVTRLGQDYALSCSASHVGSGRLVWSTMDAVPRNDLNSAWIAAWGASAFDQLCERLNTFSGFGSEEHAAARMVLTAVDHIFRLAPADLDMAGRLLDSACDLVDASTIYGWNAFLSAFRAEKEGRARNSALLERAEWLAARATELDRNNPLTIALVAHVYSFVLRDQDRAAEILAPVRDASSRSPFLADTLSMLHYYAGDYEKARSYARQAVSVGRFSPFRYSFTTSLAMSEMMLGRSEDSLRHCKAALAQHRIRGGHLYEPTLRTLAAVSGHLGLLDEGRAALNVLAKQGGYDPYDRLNTSDTPYPNPDVLAIVKRGMERLHVH